MQQARISTAIRGSVGLLELDRPRALHALTTAMVDALARELAALTLALFAALVDKTRDPAWVAYQPRTPP